jgi:hypothetical protein
VITMRVKLTSLICGVSAIAVVLVSPTYGAVNVASDGGMSAAKPPVNKSETIVAQAWWDAAANAATNQQQVVTRQAAPHYRRSSR